MRAALLTIIAAAVILCGCESTQYRAIVGVSSPGRHNVEPRVGIRAIHQDGVEYRVLYRPRLRIEDPSTRGLPREVGAFEIEVEVPL